MANFLCEHRFEQQQIKSQDGKHILPQGLFHRKYYLDGELIAVSVFCIMPHGVESYYFFYDPKYKPLSLGVVSVKWEIDFVLEKQKHFPEFKYYTPGSYIHTTHKMNYKKKYQPMELLCPVTYKWRLFD